MRRLLIPLALIAQAIGGLRWILLPIRNPQDRLRSAYLWGWLSPEMAPHFERLAREVRAARWWKKPHVLYENLKNLVSEWTRLDPYGSPGQRASKIMLAWMTLVALGCLFAGMAIGVQLVKSGIV